MNKKPIVFTFVTGLCVIEPILKVLYLGPGYFHKALLFSLVFPMAGLLILKLRKWTYFAFMLTLGYGNLTNFYLAQDSSHHSRNGFLIHNYLVMSLSLIVLVYFLTPKIRQYFFDRRLRWWEPKTRYSVVIPCKLQSSHLTFPSKILNISCSGAFVKDSKYINIGDRFVMDFIFFGRVVSLPVEVVHKQSAENYSGYGLKFNFKTLRQKIVTARVINILKSSQSEFQEDIDRTESAA